MKKISTFIFLLIVLLTSNIKTVSANVEVSYSELYLGINSSVQLTAYGDTANNLRWTSSNTKIATVINGRVFGEGYGTTYITVTNGTEADVCKIIVTADYVPIDSLTLKEDSGNISINETKQIEPIIKPLIASNKVLRYMSSNPNIATVDKNGLVTGKSIGTTYITITAESWATSYKVTVSNNVALKGIAFNSNNKIELTENETKALQIIYSPSNATNKSVIWKTSNPNVVSVDNSGYIKGISSGTAAITATSVEGRYTATVNVTVNAISKALKGISLNKYNLELKVGETENLILTYNPVNADNKEVTWKSTNNSIATVVDGKITALKPGKVDIKVISKEGNFEATCKLTIKSDPIESISFADPKQTLKPGKTVELKTVSVPSNTMIENPIWTSSNEIVAVVNKNGILTTLQEGTTIITISDKEGKVKASTTIIVKEDTTTTTRSTVEPLKITIDNYDLKFNPDQKKYTLNIDDEDKLKINVNRLADNVSIFGNQDLKNDSIITINVAGAEALTYIIEIKKSSNNTSLYIGIVIIILLINLFYIAKKQKSKKESK